MRTSVILLVVVVSLGGWFPGAVQANFSLYGTEQLVVDTHHDYGHMYDQSQVDIVSGGQVDTLYAFNLGLSGGNCINVSGGTVNMLWACVALKGNESITVDAAPTAASLTPYGVNVSGGTVNNMSWSGITANDSSVATIVGGNLSTLYVDDSSSTSVFDGSIRNLSAYGSSTVTVFGGQMTYVDTLGFSTATVSGGQVDGLSIKNSSSVTVSGGQVGHLSASGSSTATISGGSVSGLNASGFSTVIFNAHDVTCSDGLTFDDNTNRIFGTGTLSGKWFDGTPWSVAISYNDPTATILAVPEPMTLGLLMMGGVVLLRRRKP